MASTPHKEEGGHPLTEHWDWTTYHRHSRTARQGWESADIESHSEEARRPDQIPRERQCRVSMWSQKGRGSSSHARPEVSCVALGLWPVVLIIMSLG